MIRKYQDGGLAQQQELLIQMGLLIVELAQEEMQQGNKQGLYTQLVMEAQQVAQDEIQFNKTMQAAKRGDERATAIIAVLMYMQAANQAQSAKNGAKLNYIKKLRGQCPEGYEMGYFKAGGRVCKKCMKKAQQAHPVKAQNGDAIEEFKCGRKMKK